MWLTKPKIFTICFFTESVLMPTPQSDHYFKIPVENLHKLFFPPLRMDKINRCIIAIYDLSMINTKEVIKLKWVEFNK